MSINTVVRARIDDKVKKEATIVLSEIGLTVSDVFCMLLIRIAREKALSFEPLVPNPKTIEAIKAARDGDMVTVGSISDLLGSLNEKD